MYCVARLVALKSAEHRFTFSATYVWTVWGSHRPWEPYFTKKIDWAKSMQERFETSRWETSEKPPLGG